MSEFKNEQNKGAIFVNDKKGNDKAPNKVGKFVDDYGVIKKIAIWENISKNGLKYESFIISDYISMNLELNKISFIPKPDTTETINDKINEMPF
ncbi:MAG: hypothetical protein IPM06_22250 [Rhizobiales bacterium]|nr:hypothetical protein [Hyphomicrobiales bacterium]